MQPVTFTLNGTAIALYVDPMRPLLDVLRQDLRLTGTKQGCDCEGECGACTAIVNGAAVRSCITPVAKVSGGSVTTVEGLGTAANPHPLQQAFIDLGAVQCGYCTPGMLLAGKALLDRNSRPTREEIVEALEGNLCRCTGYVKIIQAVEAAAAAMRGEHSPAPICSTPPAGGDATRIDALDKVTGATLYAEDINLPGMLHLHVLRSPHHHARLVTLRVEAARQMPGVVAVLTADDIPGENSLADYSLDEHVLTPVSDYARMMGDPIALVVGTTPEAADAGAAAIQVEYELLPHTFDAGEALQDGAPLLHKDGNVLSAYETRNGDADAEFAHSDVIVESHYTSAFLEHCALERETGIGYIDEEGRVTIVCGNQEPHWQQGFIAAVLGLAPERVRVITPPMGGSFGGKQDPWPLVAIALAVSLLRQPVRLVYTRKESFEASPKRHPYEMDYRLGATADGHLTALRARIMANTGAYDSGARPIPTFAVVSGVGPYRWEAVDAAAKTVYTNGPKAGQMRGFGTPQSTFALECALDELATRLQIDPWELRYRNAVRDEVLFLGHAALEPVAYKETLDAIRPDYLAALDRARMFNGQADSSPLKRGVGLAGMWYRFGKSGRRDSEADAVLEQDGSITIHCCAADYGQGSWTTMSQLAADALGVSRRMLTIVNADTALTPDSDIQGASRMSYWVGGAVSAACRALNDAILSTASEMLDQSPDSLALRDDAVESAVVPARRISLADVAKEFDRIAKPRRVRASFDPSIDLMAAPKPEYLPLFFSGVQTAEVEVNVETGQTRVLRMVASQDSGCIINRPGAEGQMEGSIVMGLGAALMEEFIPGVTTGFGSYYIPTARSTPEIKLIFVQVPSRYGPLGAKGLGEAGVLPAAPAILNAIYHATGARVRDLPATAERILKAVRAARDSQLRL